MKHSYTDAAGSPGTLFSASADNADNNSIQTEVSQNSGVTALYYSNDWLLFATIDGSLYAKLSESDTVGLVAQGFNQVVSISSMDSFIYIADKDVGIFAIESKNDGTFSTVRKIPAKTAS